MRKSAYIFDKPSDCMSCPMRSMNLQNEFVCGISKRTVNPGSIPDHCELQEVEEQ